MTKKDKAPKKAKKVKAPKNLAISGESLAGLVTSPLVRELAADVLIAVAGALAPNRSSQKAAKNLASNASDAGGRAQTAIGAVADVVTDAARRILPSSATEEDEGERKAEFDHLAGNAGKRKRRDRADRRREH
jgi:hypothetical protein